MWGEFIGLEDVLKLRGEPPEGGTPYLVGALARMALILVWVLRDSGGEKMESHATAAGAAGIFAPRRFALLLGALVLIQFPDVVLGLKTFFFRDYGFFGYPLAAYHRDCFWRGEIPLWNPYNNAGLPFLAQWNTMVLYPGSLIYLLLPLPWSLGIFCLTHQYLAGFGMYFLGRASAKSDLGGAIAGISFAFGGLLLCSLKWPNNIAAFGWMPWVVLSVFYSRSVGIAALVGGMQMLTGAPEVIFLTWVIVGVVTVGEATQSKNFKPIGALAGIVVLVSLIAAAQLLPFLDLLGHSQRSAKFGGADWPMPWWGWANFFVPLFGTFSSYHGVPAQPLQYWTSTYYLPLAAVALAVVTAPKNWRTRLLAGIALFGALMALGDAGVLYKVFRTALPSLGFMRFPIKFVALPVFILPWLAAYGVAARPNWKSLKRVVGVFGVICVALALIPSPFTPAQPSSAVWLNSITRVIALGIFAALYFRTSKWIPVGLAVLLWLDGRLQGPELNPRAARWVFDPELPIMTNAPTLGNGRGMLDAAGAEKMDHLMFEKPEDDISASRLSLYCNANLINRIPKVDGFYSLYLRESAQLIDTMYAETNRAFPAIEKALGVSHKNIPGNPMSWHEAGTNESWLIAGRRVEFVSEEETLRRLVSADFDPDRAILLPKIETKESLQPTNVTIIDARWGAERISFRVNAAGPCAAMLKEAFHPNWRATDNGAPIKIKTADYAFQAVELSAGVHEIEFKYVDPKFRLGCALSLAGLAASCGLIWKKR